MPRLNTVNKDAKIPVNVFEAKYGYQRRGLSKTDVQKLQEKPAQFTYADFMAVRSLHLVRQRGVH